MHLSRRMRLIWDKLWLIPLVGATADVVASEAAKLGGATVPIPWLFSAIGVAGMLVGAVVQAYSVPLIPAGLEAPDEALTRRSRVLGERLGATPVRVFVSDLPKLRGKVDTFIDGHDLFVSKRVAELPEAERDFVLARALAELTPYETRTRASLEAVTVVVIVALGLLLLIQVPPRAEWPKDGISVWEVRQFGMNLLSYLLIFFAFTRLRRKRSGLDGRTWNQVALEATNNLVAARRVLLDLITKESQVKNASWEVDVLEKWWNTTGQTAVEASEWYQRELARASETNLMASRVISGDLPIELPASETN